MKKSIALVFCSFCLCACSNNTVATATPTATPEATETAAAPVETTQTAPVSEELTADGVIMDAEMSTITVNVGGQEVSFLKGDGYTCDGEETIGTQILVSYTGDMASEAVATGASCNTATQTVTGTIKEAAMNSLVLTTDSGDVTFSKSDSIVVTAEQTVGETVNVNYEGEIDNNPVAYAILAQ